MKCKFIIGLCVLPGLISAQIYTPNGLVQTSSTANVGIAVSNPSSILEIQSNGGVGVLRLDHTESSGLGGTTVIPEFAFKIVRTPLNLSSYPAFTIEGTGQTFVGDFTGFSSATSMLNVRNDLNISNGSNRYLNLHYSGINDLGLSWYSQSASNLSFSATVGSTTTNVMALSSSGQLAIGTHSFNGTEALNVNGAATINGNVTGKDFTVESLSINATTPLAKLHVQDNSATNSGATGIIHGVLIENNGWRGHDYALEIRTGKGKIFDITNSGHMHLGENLNFDIPGSDKYKLFVEDGIRTGRIRIDVAEDNGWSDFVFHPDYQLMSISELEEYVSKHRHLPNIPSEQDVISDGIDLADINKRLLQQVEELTLRIIEMDKQIKNLQKELQADTSTR